MRHKWLLLVVPVILLCWSTVLLYYSENSTSLLFFLAVIVPLFLVSVASPSLIHWSRGIGTAVFAVSSVSILLLWMWISREELAWFEQLSQDLLMIGTVAGWAFSVMGLVVTFPLALSSWISQRTDLDEMESSSLPDLKSIEQGFENIKSVFSQIQSELSRETSAIGQAMQRVTDNLLTQRTELQRVQLDLEQSRKKLRELQERARHRNRGGYRKYLSGILIGCLGSLLAKALPAIITAFSG